MKTCGHGSRRVVAGSLIASTALVVLAAVPQPVIAQEKTLRVALVGLPNRQGIGHDAFGESTVNLISAFYESVTYNDLAGNVTPGLAASWQAQGTDTWVLKLRPNLKFHNGRTFDSAAMVENIEFMLSEKGRIYSGTRNIIGVGSARAVDPTTVEIKTTAPNPILPRMLAILFPMEIKAFNEVGADVFARQPVGTGVFRVSGWQPGKVDGVAFDNGWRSPKVARITFNEIAEVPQRVQGLASGQIDVALALGPDNVAQIQGVGGKLAIGPTNNTMTMMFNIVRPGPMQDVRIRQALNYAVNKEAFVKNVVRADTRVATQPSTSIMSGFNRDLQPYPYDPARAKALLAEAGHPNGLKLTAEIITGIAEFSDMFQHIASDVKQVGIDLELRIISRPDLIAKMLGQKQWESDAFSMQYEGFPTNDAMRNMLNHSCMAFTRAWNCMQEIMPRIEAANREFDVAKRDQIMREIMKFYRDQATALYMYERVQIDGLGRNVENYAQVNRAINWHDIVVR
ncbi:MAG: ABC transporter substrate-binding protein [Alphaproteobacteria bacterium]|nr:ABC transporter substrate-binding protein [Alphaproteobacteria bacterium]